MALRFLFVFPVVLLLQSTGSNPAVLFYERGRLAMEQGKAELAARSFRMARSLCLLDIENANSTHQLSLIADALPKIDPYSRDRDKLMNSIARNLVTLARRYLKKGWMSTAKPYLDAAGTLDPSVGRKEREQVAAGQKVKKTTPEVHSFFRSLRSIWELQGWKRDEDQILAPHSETDESTAILARNGFETGYRIQIEILLPDKVSRAGIYFGYQDKTNFHYMEISYADDGVLYLELYHRHNDEFEKLESIPVDRKLLKGKSWAPIILEVREGEVCFALAGAPLWASLQPGSDLSGMIGLTATCQPGTQGSVRFRAFHFEELLR